MGVRRRLKRFFAPPLEIGAKNKKMFENLTSASPYRLRDLNSCNNNIFTGMALTLHKSQLHCSGVMSLQFTHVHSFVCSRTLCKRTVLMFLLVV